MRLIFFDGYDELRNADNNDVILDTSLLSVNQQSMVGFMDGVISSYRLNTLDRFLLNSELCTVEDGELIWRYLIKYSLDCLANDFLKQ
jgi:hypothetical protein